MTIFLNLFIYFSCSPYIVREIHLFTLKNKCFCCIHIKVLLSFAEIKFVAICPLISRYWFKIKIIERALIARIVSEYKPKNSYFKEYSRWLSAADVQIRTHYTGFVKIQTEKEKKKQKRHLVFKPYSIVLILFAESRPKWLTAASPRDQVLNPTFRKM